MNLTKPLVLTIMIAFLSVSALGCAKEESAGDKLDNAISGAQEGMEDAAKEAEEAVEEAKEAMEE